jgi:hypothetical protein
VGLCDEGADRMMLLGFKLRSTVTSRGILQNIGIHIQPQGLISRYQIAASMSVNSHTRAQAPMKSSKLRIAVLQFAPEIGRVEENIEKARKLCSS